MWLPMQTVYDYWFFPVPALRRKQTGFCFGFNAE